MPQGQSATGRLELGLLPGELETKERRTKRGWRQAKTPELADSRFGTLRPPKAPVGGQERLELG